MTDKFFMGVDPGKSGAAVVMDAHEKVCGVFEFAKGGEAGWLEFLDFWKLSCPSVLMEKVGAMPAQGVSSTFKFGDNNGFLRGSLMMAGYPITLVTPQKWQAGLMLPRAKTVGKTAHKRNLRDAATRLIPHKWTLATADAALIALHAARAKSLVGLVS